MFNLQKIGRDLLSASSVADVVEVVSYQRPNKQELTNLKLQTVLQSAKANFREQPPSPSKCRLSLVEVLVTLISRGQEFSQSEMTDIFFAATQLFNLSDWHIRRLIYVMLDSLKNGIIGADEAFMLTAPLQKDLEKGDAPNRSRAIRRMCRIDPTIASQIEPQIKNALLDKNPEVSSAALVYGEYLLQHAPHLVQRWGQQVTSAIKQNNKMAQAHACRLIFSIKSGDRMALVRQIQSTTDKGPRQNDLSPEALVYTLQQAEDILLKYPGSDTAFEVQIIAYLQDCTGYYDAMVAFQASKSIISLAASKQYPTLELSRAIGCLKEFLNHTNPVYRFGAIRAFHKLSSYLPDALVQMVGEEGELQRFQREQMHQPTLSILAVTTLLNAGNEETVPGILHTLSLQRSVDMPEAFKLDTIRAVASLANKFPQKYDTFLTFLNQQARLLASLEYKELLIQTIIQIGEVDQKAHQKVLDALCEFIEDSEYHILTAYIIERITEMLCSKKVSNVDSYIRFIFNRLILEPANVRSSSLSGLARIAETFPELRESISKLLSIHGSDNDYGIRDVASSFAHSEDSTCCPSDDELIAGETLQDLKALYWTEAEAEDRIDVGCHIEATTGTDVTEPVEVEKVESKSPSELIALLQKNLPNIRLSSVIKKWSQVQLTSAEAEYIVCAKGSVIQSDCSESLLAFEFSVTNGMEDMILMNVSPQITAQIEGVEPLTYIPIESLNYDETKIVYFLTKVSKDNVLEDELKLPIRFAFTVNEDGYIYDDEYDVEPLVVRLSEMP